MDLNKIIKNPFFGQKSEVRPSWLCKHMEAKVMDHENKVFICFKCSPRTGVVRKISQVFMLSQLSANNDRCN